MRTDSTHICQAVRDLNRLESVGEALRHAFNTLAVVAPAWLQQWVPDAWIERYARRFDNYRLPKEEARRAGGGDWPGWEHAVVDAIHAHLAKRELVPSTHLVDSGYMSAQHVINQATTYGVDLVGAVQAENSWQARSPDGLGISQFSIYGIATRLCINRGLNFLCDQYDSKPLTGASK